MNKVKIIKVLPVSVYKNDTAPSGFYADIFIKQHWYSEYPTVEKGHLKTQDQSICYKDKWQWTLPIKTSP